MEISTNRELALDVIRVAGEQQRYAEHLLRSALAKKLERIHAAARHPNGQPRRREKRDPLTTPSFIRGARQLTREDRQAPNASCECGSGLKFKKCCRGAQ